MRCARCLVYCVNAGPEDDTKDEARPPGMTLAEWLWPFKTDAQREVVARWFKRKDAKARGQGEEALM